MPRSEILADLSIDTLHDERAACLLLTTDAYAGSDSVKEYYADYADRISDEIDRRNDAQPDRKDPIVDFQTAIASVTADLTPQPWDYTATDGAHLTVIPAGLPEDPGCAEVLIRVTDSGQTIEAGIPTAYLPGLIEALEGFRMWSHDTLDDVTVQLLPFGGGGMIVALSEDPEGEEAGPQVHVPEAQRLPLASALRRALDVARGWES